MKSILEIVSLNKIHLLSLFIFQINILRRHFFLILKIGGSILEWHLGSRIVFLHVLQMVKPGFVSIP